MITESEIVYKNIMRFCEYRGAKITSTILDAEAFRKTLEANYYVQINAERESSDIRGAAHIVIIQFSVHQFIDSSVQKFRAFIKKIIRDKPADAIQYNIIFIASGPPKTAVLRIMSEVEENILVEYHQAKKFLIVVPEHVYVPKHTIVAQDEVNKMCDTLHIQPQSLPCILQNDPMAVWLGIKPGMIVRIERTIETAGIETTYRRCI